MLTTTELNRIDDFDAVRATWHRLWSRDRAGDVLSNARVDRNGSAHYPDPQKLRVILVERRGEIIGIVPFCVRTERRKVGSLRMLTYPLNDWGTFFGPIGPQPGTAFRAALRHIRSTPRDWDLIDLCWVDEAASEFLEVGLAMREAGFGLSARPRMEVRICRMDGDWESFVAGKSHNWRRQMRRDLHQLEAAGEVRLLRYRPEAGGSGAEPEHFEIYQLCEEIAKKSWQADAELQSTLCSPRVREGAVAAPSASGGARDARRGGAAGRRAAGGVLLQLRGPRARLWVADGVRPGAELGGCREDLALSDDRRLVPPRRRRILLRPGAAAV